MFSTALRCLSVTLVAFATLTLPAVSATGRVTPLTQAMAIAAVDDDVLATFYRESGYAPLWVGPGDRHRARREALLRAVDRADLHGLPAGRYDVTRLRGLMASARTASDRGALDVELSRVLLRFAADLQTGILDPNGTVPAIKREKRIRDRLQLLRELEQSRPHAFMKALTPRSHEYTRLMGEKLRLEEVISLGSWGAPIRVPRLEEGMNGADVVLLRDRLIAMGYLRPSAGQIFDERLQEAVESFQKDHGLAADGIVGDVTLAELNASPERRLGQVLVAMERERWMNIDRDETHIWVNLTDFHARIIRDEEVIFETRSVIGNADPDRQTPEFSDTMDHLVINPTWYVPRSIAVNEYLPGLRVNPGAHGHLQVVDRRGRVVNRAQGFGQYTARSFPYSMRQSPGPTNALGRVKFMFPNRYNIYLHDTPSQHLFNETVRAFSHGCIRLDDPYEFAYALLGMQSDDPRGEFHRRLDTGRETRVNLVDSLPVHLVYRTAIAKPGGGMEYRRDVYGRDARILNALMTEGVRLRGLDRRLALSEVDG